MRKKSVLLLVLLASVLALGVAIGRSQGTTSDVEMDGKAWLASSIEERRAFLYGAGSAVALEYQARMTMADEPSPFVKGWTQVFNDKTWPEIESELTSYYVNNPDKRGQHVFHVIWNVMIKPNRKG